MRTNLEPYPSFQFSFSFSFCCGILKAISFGEARKRRWAEEGSTVEEMASFSAPEVHVNFDGWGPTSLPEKFANLPFANFGKGDRLGRAADFAKDRFGRTRFREREESVTAEDAYVTVEGEFEIFVLHVFHAHSD